MNIDICIDYALSKNGKCLSKEYKNCRTKMLWECSEKHRWETTWNHVKNMNQWCKKCFKNNRKTNIIELQQYALNKNGILISDIYENNNTDVLWQCKEKHIFFGKWMDIKKGMWCKECFDNKCRLDIDVCKKYALNKNGLLISQKYKNNSEKLLWRCSNNHDFEMSWNSVSQGRWCSECSSSENEKICKASLEEILGIKFKKIRFLYKGQRLEFDGYNEEHKIAFEYQGRQHYEFPNHCHKTEEEFIMQIERDTLKTQYALKNKINLMTIPHNVEMGDYIKNVQFINYLRS